MSLVKKILLCSAVCLGIVLLQLLPALLGGPAVSPEPPAPAAPSPLYVPHSILAPEWLAQRRRQQWAAASEYSVFCAFSFTDQVDSSGIGFHHRIVPDSGQRHIPVHYDHGNGVAAADVDGDSRVDLYWTNQAGGNQLWGNVGAGRFADLTRPQLALADRVSAAASFADTDNDGDADLYVTSVRGGNVFFANDGAGGFTDRTEAAGLGYAGHSSAALFFDYDRDGLVDVLLANVGVYTGEETAPLGPEGDGSYYVGLKDAFAGHLNPGRAEVSLLFRNMGGNRFVDVTREMGLVDSSWSGDAAPCDIDEDGWPDLYLLDMQGNDEYYQNMGGHRFEKKSRQVFPRTPWGSMGIQVFDWDNDGRLDIYITDMHSDMTKDVAPEREKEKAEVAYTEEMLNSGGRSIFGNAFYRNLGGGRFAESSDAVGAESYWPWGLSTGDLNADGWEDVFISASMNYPFRYGVNSVLLNDRGRGFLDSEFVLGVEPRRAGRTATPWFELDCDGADQSHRHCRERWGRVLVHGALGSRGSVLFDLEGDGDLDIVTSEFNAAPMVLVSDLSQRTAVGWLSLELVGGPSNRSGLGAVVRVRAGGQVQTQVRDGQSGYLSQSLLPLYFGLGPAQVVEGIDVDWPSGRRQHVLGPLAVNQRLVVVEEVSGSSK